jgi:hypothetical protein
MEKKSAIQLMLSGLKDILIICDKRTHSFLKKEVIHRLKITIRNIT